MYIFNTKTDYSLGRKIYLESVQGISSIMYNFVLFIIIVVVVYCLFYLCYYYLLLLTTSVLALSDFFWGMECMTV